MSGSVDSHDGTCSVRQTFVFAGDTIAMPPSSASFSTGMMIWAHPELNVPIRPIRSELPAYDDAFSEHLPESQAPACAVESSHIW